jgi:putative endonuclease
MGSSRPPFALKFFSPFRHDDSWRYAPPVSGHVYIPASRRHGTVYIGSTTDLPKRMYEHRQGLVAGFTRTHAVKRLVYVETYDDISDAIVRERRMKEWQRNWKVRLIEQDNPYWEDLAVSLLRFDPLKTGKAKLL